MALFTRLDEEDLGVLAGRFRLGAVTRVEGLEEGTINSNYFVDFGAERFFLRVNEGKREEDVRYEAALVGHLAERGVPTPKPVVADDGEPFCLHRGRYLTLFPRVDGVHRDFAMRSERDLHAVGHALARLHVAAEDFPKRRESQYAFDKIVERRDWISQPLPAEIDEELGAIAAAGASRDALPRGVIHGDLFPDNVLWQDTRLSALIDFEQASDGTLLYDLAVTVLAWCFGEDDFSWPLAKALVAGYQTVRPLTANERDGFALEARAAAVRFAITRLTDVELNPAVPPERKRAKDWRRFHARLLHLRSLGDDGFTALAGSAA